MALTLLQRHRDAHARVAAVLRDGGGVDACVDAIEARTGVT